MEEARNTTVVQEMYAAFGRGDTQTLLSKLADDVVWTGLYGAGSHVPTAGERRGKAAVAEFFKQVAEHVNFSRFEPKEFVATGDKVWRCGTTPRHAEKRASIRISPWFHASERQVTGFRSAIARRARGLLPEWLSRYRASPGHCAAAYHWRLLGTSAVDIG